MKYQSTIFDEDVTGVGCVWWEQFRISQSVATAFCCGSSFMYFSVSTTIWSSIFLSPMSSGIDPSKKQNKSNQI
jgi:hypothetical protein